MYNNIKPLPVYVLPYQCMSKDSPAVVVAAQTPLPVGIFEGVIRVLEGLIPEEAGFATVQAGLVLETPVVFPIGSVTLWEKEKIKNSTQSKSGLQ